MRYLRALGLVLVLGLAACGALLPFGSACKP
jgi:hypothetical protein